MTGWSAGVWPQVLFIGSAMVATALAADGEYVLTAGAGAAGVSAFAIFVRELCTHRRADR